MKAVLKQQDVALMTPVPNKELKLMPYRNICCLRLFFPNTKPRQMVVGTGIAVGPRTVLTAAHNLHHRVLGKLSRLDLRAGNIIIPDHAGLKWEPCSSWIGDNIVDTFSLFDYGFITTPKKWRFETPFPVDPTSIDLSMKQITVAGYPLDNKIYPPPPKLRKKTGKITASSSRSVEYDVDTSGGVSGSPIYYKDDLTNLDTVIAMHTNSAAAMNERGEGLRITSEINKEISEHNNQNF
jgi:glutamyl endopeptidase